MDDAPLDMETAFERLVDLALANVEALAKKSDRTKLAAQINRDAVIVRRGVHWSAVMNDAVMPDDFLDCAQPPRLDLAVGAIAVAMNTTTDPEVKPWLQTALDFLNGDYEPLEDEDDTERELTPAESERADAAWERHKAAGPGAPCVHCGEPLERGPWGFVDCPACNPNPARG